jgi:hypothetical protein
MLVLSMELFGVKLAVAEFPRVKSLRGLGVTDANQYASQLAGKLDYRNTFYDREPRFDLANPSEHELGKFDFIIASEIMEHVPTSGGTRVSKRRAVAQTQWRADPDSSILTQIVHAGALPGSSSIRLRRPGR